MADYQAADFKSMVALVDALKDAPKGHRITLVDARGRESSFTWREFHRKIVGHAAWLKTQGIRQNDRIIVSPTNDPDVLASFLGLFYLGAVPLSVSGAQLGQAAGSQLDFIASLFEAADARAVLTQNELISGNDERRLIPEQRLIDYVPSSVLLEDFPSEMPPAEVGEEDLAFVQFSSGSTSRPKGVRISHTNVTRNVRFLAQWGDRTPEECAATWLPLYHDMGLMGSLLSCMWLQLREIVLMNPIRFLMKPIAWIDRLSKMGARVTVCPNFALDLCTDRISDKQLDENEVDLSSLKLVYIGAEPVRPKSIRRFEDRFGNWGFGKRVLHPVYGLAEGTLIVTAPEFEDDIVTRSVDGVDIPSVGYPIDDYQVRIVAQDGDDLPQGSIGELWLKGRSVTSGYLDEMANEELFREGWLRTGDLGLRDESGRIFITGRAKDLIIINGKNYYSHDIVADLEILPFIERGKVHVLSLAVEGKEQMIIMTVPTARMSHQVRQKIKDFEEFMRKGGPRGWLKNIEFSALEAWVERLLASDKVDLQNDIKRFVLARFGIPVHDVVFVPRIPRTTSGKVRREACEKLCREQEGNR